MTYDDGNHHQILGQAQYGRGTSATVPTRYFSEVIYLFLFLRVLSSDSYCLCSYEISLRIYLFFCSYEFSLRIHIVFVLASSLSAMIFYLFLWVLSPEWYCLCSFVNGQSLLMSFIMKTVKMILLGDIWEKDIPTNQQSYW